MDRDSIWLHVVGARLKKLTRAFRFALGGTDAESMCEKDEHGQCTGNSRLRWQEEVGVYTTECPARLIKQYAPLFSIWQRWKIFGNWEDGGSLNQPFLWTHITEGCEIEYKRRQNERPTVEGLLSGDT